MKTRQALRGDWKFTGNRSYCHIEKLSTAKGVGYVKTNDGERIEVKVSIKVIVNGVDTEKWAQLETNEITYFPLAQLFVEGLLL